MTVLAGIPEVPTPTLQDDAAEVELFGRIVAAVRALETSEDVRQVIASPAHGVIVVMDHAYNHVALRVVAS